MTTSLSTQAGRAMSVTTPLGPDALLLLGFRGEEAISRLFRFELDLATENPDAVSFPSLLGRRATIRLEQPGGQARFFNGICSRFAQGVGTTEVMEFRMEVVPAAWVLTRKVQSRIFQDQPVTEILREVFRDVPDVTFDFAGRYQPRNFCVQYRETDFNFASRLMEEEGISYFFRHTSDAHEMVISDRGTFPALGGPDLILRPMEQSKTLETRVTHWEKAQGLRSGKVTLRDSSFQLPGQDLEAAVPIPDAVTAGRAEHKLRVGKADAMEVYDWPGEYASRFDGLDRAGGDRPGELQKIFQDNVRTATIRAEQEATEAIQIRGAGGYRHLSSGHTFAISQTAPETHVGGGAHDGRYYLTAVSHQGRMGDSYRSGGDGAAVYQNTFSCLPVGIKYRPPRVTPKPVIQGTQTATVVGPPGEEIHTDKYGRVKLKFPWDRNAPGDDGSSCWVRVAQIAAGGGFGGIHIPRVGQEVVVQFEEGEPDRPIVVGSVYNPAQMPPFALPKGRMISGLRSNTYPGGGGLNEITVDDTKGRERMYLHAQYNQDTVVGNDRTAQVGRDSTESIKQDEKITIGRNQAVAITEGQTLSVGKDQRATITGGQTLAVGKDQAITVRGNSTQAVTGTQSEHAREIVLTADTRITLQCGASTIILTPALIEIHGPLVKINC